MSLVIGMVLDALLGEPKWLWSRVPHPAVLMGRLIAAGEARLNHGAARRLKGVLLMLVLVVVSVGLGWCLSWGGWPVEAIVVAVLLAQRSLVEHVAAVADGLGRGLSHGRSEVAMIVGRDTREMDAAAVSRAAIESAAENFSDGVAAPMFWFAVAGLPGIIAYKMVNTADSMIGHRNMRYERFGWAAARLDDVLNLIPARLSGLVFAALGGVWRQWREIVTEARQHRSPNAGWPEAAVARALGVALSGPRIYEGSVHDLPWVHPDGRRDAGPRDIAAACGLLWGAWSILLLIAVVVWLI